MKEREKFLRVAALRWARAKLVEGHLDAIFDWDGDPHAAHEYAAALDWAIHQIDGVILQAERARTKP